MTIHEAQKEQWKSIKNRSPKEKFSYFGEYFGIKSICLLLAIIAATAFIINMITKKDYAFTGNAELFLYYSYLEYAVDLRTVFPPEEMERLFPYLHYIDGKLIEQQENAGKGYANAYSRRPDSAKPELMENPIPVAISLNAATDAFKETYHFGDEAVNEKNCNFVLFVGNKRLIKRRLLDKYLEQAYSI